MSNPSKHRIGILTPVPDRPDYSAQRDQQKRLCENLRAAYADLRKAVHGQPGDGFVATNCFRAAAEGYYKAQPDRDEWLGPDVVKALAEWRSMWGDAPQPSVIRAFGRNISTGLLGELQATKLARSIADTTPDEKPDAPPKHTLPRASRIKQNEFDLLTNTLDIYVSNCVEGKNIHLTTDYHITRFGTKIMLVNRFYDDMLLVGSGDGDAVVKYADNDVLDFMEACRKAADKFRKKLAEEKKIDAPPFSSQYVHLIPRGA